MKSDVSVYDCFMFFNEVDLLEMRLQYYWDVVDKFVIVEADKTHAGNKKEGSLLDYSSRFKPYWDKMIYVPVVFPEGLTAMDRDWWQRDQLAIGLREARVSTLVFVSDLDEFWDVNKLDKALDNFGLTGWVQRIYYYYLNRWDFARMWLGSGCMRLGLMLDFKLTPNLMRQRVRAGSFPSYVESGWHFGWLGGAEKVLYKLQNYAHVEDNIPERDMDFVKYVLALDDDLLRNGVKHRVVPIDSSFPSIVVNNVDKYRKLGWIDESFNTDAK